MRHLNENDVFSTEREHAYAQDEKPANPLWDRSHYNYNLPEERIAQVPLEDRSASKMLVLDKNTGEVKDEKFINIVKYLNPGDVLVRNNTKVIPARVFGILDGQSVEMLLLGNQGNLWKAMISVDVLPGDIINCVIHNSDPQVVPKVVGRAQVIDSEKNGASHIQFDVDGWAMLDEVGETPLPPYVQNQDRFDQKKVYERYNTVYANKKTSAAAPTAGLHFTPEVFDEISAKGIEVLDVCLDVGLGTFRPVLTNNVKNHIMHTEHYSVTKEVIEKIKACKERGNRVVCVGTTSLRTLESVPKSVWNAPRDFESDTGIFIYPDGPKKVEVCDVLLTNFHAPESTLVMLVSALAGYDNIMNAYKHGVDNEYRFLSFGDCMLITNDLKNGGSNEQNS